MNEIRVSGGVLMGLEMMMRWMGGGLLLMCWGRRCADAWKGFGWNFVAARSRC